MQKKKGRKKRAPNESLMQKIQMYRIYRNLKRKIDPQRDFSLVEY